MERLDTRTRVMIGLAMVVGIIIIGVTGYMLIEGDSFLNALYMTIITVSTVGFGEIHRLSDSGKIFTIGLIVISFTTYAYALTTISTHFFEGQLRLLLRGYGSKNFKRMENHVIICGYGRNGRQAARELAAYQSKFIVIDQNSSVLTDEGKEPGFPFVEGDATQDEVLLRDNIKKARALITTLPVDADNLYVVLTARALNPDLEIISRASDERSEVKLRMAGVDNVVMPERVGGAHMANLVTNPDIIEFMEHLSIHSESPTTLEEVNCQALIDEQKVKSIGEYGIRKRTGANIIGFKTPDGRFIMNPTPDMKLFPGSKLFVLGTREQINEMKKILRES